METPTSTTSDQTISYLKDQLVGNEVVRVKIPSCMSWLDAYDEPLEDIIGILIKVESLDETSLEDIGLNTCNHDCPLSSREVINFDEPKPQPPPLPSCPSLDISLIEKRGPEPPIKPHSLDSFRMKAVDNLTIHISPSPHVASFHPKDTYCYYHPCIGDPKKHHGFKSGLLGLSGSLGVDLSNWEMIKDDWKLEPKEFSFLGRRLNLPIWPKELENEARHKQNFKKGGFRNQQRLERKQDKFTLLTKTPKEVFALDKRKFKPPLPMTTPVETKNASKFCKFYGEVGHTTDECMHLKRQIEERPKAEKLSHLIKELKQSNRKDQAKTKKKRSLKKGQAAVVTFPPFEEEDGMVGPMIIKAEMGGHCVHRMYVNEGSSLKILYEHCFNRFRLEVRKQMVPATTPLVGFSGEIIWPLGKISLLVKIGDKEHSTSAWMNFMVVRTVTLQRSMIISLECTMVLGPGVPQPVINQVTEEKFRLNGKLVSLNRFLSKLAEKSSPFFKTLKKYTKKSDIQWTAEAETAFKQMKKLIAKLPMLTAPEEKEEPIIYLAAAKEAISAVLMTERDGKQMLVYFVSHALQGLEINYTPMEKLILTLVSAKRPEDDPLDTPMEDKDELSDPSTFFTDRSSCTLKYLEKFKNLTSTFKEFSIKQIPRGENKKADVLSKMASTSFAYLSKQLLIEELKEKSIDEKEVLAVVEEEGRTWMTPIYEYLVEEILLEEKRKARAIRRKAGRYVVANGILYKSMHAGPRFVVVKALRSGYYWPTIHADARKLIRECNSCQGIDIAGPLPEGPERANRSLREGIKARSDERSKNLLEEILHVLWAHCTMIKSSNEETPFSLTYGTEAMIPVEIGMPTLRTAEVDMVKNYEALEINLDLLEEKKSRQQSRKQKVKLRWKNTTTSEFAI
uniref:Reverse transcriptase/retrotransposon-derived protein RNase H-like domain-containing protein n=1 Tax=Tanacetum cinerariifolium TaxID=118510 RepID=A0A6L2L4F4_TANCI|nr:hypothetical protein [Tanacetum cinerariifolium]